MTTLYAGYVELRLAVAHFLGYGLTAESWSADAITEIGMVMNSGLRQFYLPPKIEGQKEPHQWSFLKPIATQATVGTYSTGTVEVSSGTCTLSDGTWPSWAATHGTLTIDSTEYSITTRDSDSELTVVGDDVDAGESYTLQHSGNYTLPADFAGIEGPLTYDSPENKADIQIVGEGQIRSLRRGTTTRSHPRYAAIRPIESDGAARQTFEIMFFPIPNDAYTLSYRKIVQLNALTAEAPYPLGGDYHGETIIESCLAVAELRSDDTMGNHQKKFIERLTASIEYDKQAQKQEYFGYCGDNSGSRENVVQRHQGAVIATYKGNY